MFKFSVRSENNLIGVNPVLVEVARRALEITEVDFIVIEGLRSPERQQELYKSGKSKTLKSNHLIGDAIDVIPVKTTWDVEEFRPVLRAFATAASELGVKLRFGVNWKNNPDLPPSSSFIDAPHIELVKE